VMYLGRIVEHGEAEAVLNAPAHPYTRALLEAVPRIGSRFGSRSGALSADLPSPASPPSGCHFHPRCTQALDTCRTVYPSMTEAGSHHGAACHLLRR
ncbi:MAG: ABC transporter ATP-binding protein, partial [Betaproteobacteria bacterium]|nr:ABC transporter ATP-binding protein [Betaproteobacteria bacterium]